MKKRYVICGWAGRVGLLLLTMLPAFAQNAAPVALSGQSLTDNPNLFLLILALCLLFPIYILGKILVMSVRIYHEKNEQKNQKNTLPSLWLPLCLLFATQTMYAQQALSKPAAATTLIGNEWLYYVLIGTILLEAVLLLFLSARIISFLRPPTLPSTRKSASLSSRLATWWSSVNNFRPIEEEGDLDSGHDYDGIRELNNATPPWFTFAFALSITFAVFYLWRYHVVQSAPLQLEEFAIEMEAAEVAKNEYLKKQANAIDENNVSLLGDSDLAEGQKLFAQHCVACHSANGAGIPGGVGPNLTDDYWIHGDKIQDVFKTIKYGYPDKGMKSWKDDFSPRQMAQLATYIERIKGTNIAGGKEAQGEKVNPANNNSANSQKDSTNMSTKTDSLSAKTMPTPK